MSGILWRIIIAVVSVTLALKLIPPVCRMIGLDLGSDALLVVQICIAGLAFYYIIKGKWPAGTVNP